MNRKRKVLYAILMIGLIIGTIYCLGIITRPTETDTSLNTINTFHDLPEESIEVIGYGSSRMWKGVDPIVMYENYGIGMYNYGCNWQRFNTTYMFFLDSLETQSPDVVIFEVRNVYNLLDDVDIEGEIYYTKAIGNLAMKSSFLYQYFEDELDRYISYFIPVFAFHENWKSLSENSFKLNGSSKDFYASMGYSGSVSVQSVEPVDSSTFAEYELPESSVEILDNIVAICEENDIEIIFYVSPSAGTFNYSDAMTAYAEANDCTYFDGFDYIDEMGIDWETDFRDGGHFNNSGATKLSDFLGAYIAENYDVTDMRTVEDNLWQSGTEN